MRNHSSYFSMDTHELIFLEYVVHSSVKHFVLEPYFSVTIKLLFENSRKLLFRFDQR